MKVIYVKVQDAKINYLIENILDGLYRQRGKFYAMSQGKQKV